MCTPPPPCIRLSTTQSLRMWWGGACKAFMAGIGENWWQVRDWILNFVCSGGCPTDSYARPSRDRNRGYGTVFFKGQSTPALLGRISLITKNLADRAAIGFRFDAVFHGRSGHNPPAVGEEM